jgi:regulator of sirC expression with transglutaminase-like and TPR domain
VSASPRPGLLARWRALLDRGEPDLFDGALLIGELVDPAEDADEARRTVAGLAARMREDGREALLPALTRVLFEEEGFSGDEESYDEPSNSSVGRVLARRRGMPITLSIVAMEVGKLAGLRLTGIGLPGHFVVGGPDLPEGMYLDPFGGGALCDAEALSRRLGAIFGAPVALGSDALRPDPARAILARVLLNLRRSYERRNRWEDALAALELSEALEPRSGTLLRERGLLLLKCGRSAEAVVALEEYVATAEAEDAEPVAKLIETIRESGVTEDAETADEKDPNRRIFTLEEARALLPRVKELTSDAVARFGKLPGDQEDERRAIVEGWVGELESLGCEIKGLWLVDFDSGGGYYCWKYPEPALDHFHGYDEGFSGRLALQ